MERQQLISEIRELAAKISHDADRNDDLTETASRLFELAAWLKHLPENDNMKTLEIPALPEKQESPSVKIQEPVSAAPMDLFSQDPPPVPEKPVETVSAPESGKNPPPAKKATEESLADKLKKNKITDLKTVIGINEKFQFINELFEGNMKEYNVALDQLNSLKSFEEAENYLDNLAEVYKWSTENPVAENFKELAQRLFT